VCSIVWQGAGKAASSIVKKYRRPRGKGEKNVSTSRVILMGDMALNKKVFSIGSVYDESDEKRYWLERTPEERLAALELNRKLVYGYDPSTARLQRDLEVIDQA